MAEINKKNLLITSIFLLAVFILAIVVWYSPVMFKGYSSNSPSTGSLLARNLHQSGLYSIENNLNVALSSNSIKDQSILSAGGNKLTPILYSKIFNFIGLPQVSDLILLSIFISALTLIIFTGIVLYLFNFKTALIFSLIYIFLPFNWQLPYAFSVYEFALLFLSLFFLFYFYGIAKQQEYKYLYLIISGGFLALACLSKEALLLIVPFLLVYLWLRGQKRYLFCIFIPFLILWGSVWLPDIKHNVYLQIFTTETSEKVKSADFAFYGHVYPDPYTYHFEREEFIKNLQERINGDNFVLMKEIDLTRELKNMGIAEIGLVDRIRAGLTLGSRHVFRFVSLEEIGGPFILLLILLGFYTLRRENKSLYQFFVYWVSSSIFLMSFVALVGRNHLMDFNWAIALVISLGLLTLGKIVNNYFQVQNKKATIIYLVILLAVLYQLVLVNHVAWSKIYDNSNNLIIEAYSQEIRKIDIADDEIIAINLGEGTMYSLSYLTNKSVVLFRSETIENLLAKDELDFAFEQFNVKYILGYSEELSKKIVNQVNVINVASDSLKPVIPELSRNKGWLMNLLK
ncbi:MAG: hypothetical protein ABII95_02600 [Patescibacteria group bacterium]|nr:glycosyltransferase family 39 protein [Patescibacteria group bacterium]